MTTGVLVAVAVIASAVDVRAVVVVVPADVMAGTGLVITGGSGASGGSGLTGAGAGGTAGHSPVTAGGVALAGEGEPGEGEPGVGESGAGAPSDGMACVGTAGEGEAPFVGLLEGAAPGGVIGDTCGDWLSTGILPRSVIEMCHDDRSEVGLAEVERAAFLPSSTYVAYGQIARKAAELGRVRNGGDGNRVTYL